MVHVVFAHAIRNVQCLQVMIPAPHQYHIIVLGHQTMGRGIAVSCLSQLRRPLMMPMARATGSRPHSSAVTALATIKRTFVCSNTGANAYLPSTFPPMAPAGIRLLSTPRIVGPPPQLFDFIIQLRFDEVLKRVKSHPHEVSYPHPRRWTALHACVEYGAPIEVVEALVHAYPDALNMKDWRGQTPLDVALTDVLKEYLASIDIETAEGSDADGIIQTDNLAVEVAPENSHNVLQHIDKISQQVANLRRQCDSLEDEIRKLRKALTKR